MSEYNQAPRANLEPSPEQLEKLHTEFDKAYEGDIEIAERRLFLGCDNVSVFVEYKIATRYTEGNVVPLSQEEVDDLYPKDSDESWQRDRNLEHDSIFISVDLPGRVATFITLRAKDGVTGAYYEDGTQSGSSWSAVQHYTEADKEYSVADQEHIAQAIDIVKQANLLHSAAYIGQTEFGNHPELEAKVINLAESVVTTPTSRRKAASGELINELYQRVQELMTGIPLRGHFVATKIVDETPDTNTIEMVQASSLVNVEPDGQQVKSHSLHAYESLDVSRLNDPGWSHLKVWEFVLKGSESDIYGSAEMAMSPDDFNELMTDVELVSEQDEEELESMFDMGLISQRDYFTYRYGPEGVVAKWMMKQIDMTDEDTKLASADNITKSIDFLKRLNEAKSRT